MKIQSTNSVNESKIKAVLNGLSGAGKTTAVKSLKQSGFKPLVLSFEAGLLSIAGSEIDYIDGTTDDNNVVIPKDLRIDRLMDIYKYVHSKDAQTKYDVLYIDSLTEISQCMLDKLRKEYPDRKDNLVMYGELSSKMRDMIKAFRDTPHYHVIFTCLGKVEKDENGTRYMGFDLIGSIADKLPQFFDEVFYLRVGNEGQREYVCNSTANIIAKDRSGRLTNVETTDLGAIFSKILNKEKK
jgi:ribosomal protein S13